MTRTLYLDCSRGISGDMVVAALLDAGANETDLRRALASLKLDGYEIVVSRRLVSGLDVCDFDVVLDAAHDGHDHDMHWLYDELDEPEGQHEHDHGHAHDHHLKLAQQRGHTHVHEHHHEHRGPAEVKAIINGSELSPHAKEIANKIFAILAEAEAKAHGVPVEQVHFHEVGAVDSIVDVAATAFCVDDLHIDEVVVSPLGEGHGRVRCAHGVLPVPVPAVANIACAHGLALETRDVAGELVTPTGAAIAAALQTRDELPSPYRIVGVGTGAGKRAYDPPSTVRATIVEQVEKGQVKPNACGMDEPTLWKLETEVDDCTGEALGRTLERLMASGAYEVHYLPVFMKKGRPGYQLEVLCSEQSISELEGIIFEDTTTIGIRRQPLLRTALNREIVEVETIYGPAKAKAVELPNGERRLYPEYETVIALAEQAKVSYQVAYQAVVRAAG